MISSIFKMVSNGFSLSLSQAFLIGVSLANKNHSLWKPGFIFLVTYYKKGKGNNDWSYTHWHWYRIYVTLNIAYYIFVYFFLNYRGWISWTGSMMWFFDLHLAEEWSRNSNVTLNYTFWTMSYSEKLFGLLIVNWKWLFNNSCWNYN